MKTLIIVDPQFDFTNPEGSLFVPGSGYAMEYIAAVADAYDNIIITLDWHTPQDGSFKENGGQWPRHCVAFSVGASIDSRLLDIANDSRTSMFYKGEVVDTEEYGAFEVAYENDIFDNLSENNSMWLNPKDSYTIVGVAGDYCVWETYKNLKARGYDIVPDYDGIAFIGDEFDFEKEYSECE